MTPPPVGHRSEILVVARRLFMARGYRAVTTREIADAVGVTQPALYHHFGGKEALYTAVLEESLASRSEAMWDAVRLDKPATTRLAMIAKGIAERADDDLTQMFHDLRHEVSERTRARIGTAFREAMMVPMFAILDALVEEGAVGPIERLELTQAEAAMFILSVIRMLTEGSAGPARGPARSPAEIGDTTVQIVLNGIGSHTADRGTWDGANAGEASS